MNTTKKPVTKKRGRPSGIKAGEKVWRLGRMIRGYREINEMAMVDLGRATGLDVGAISMFERGSYASPKTISVMMDWLFKQV